MQIKKEWQRMNVKQRIEGRKDGFYSLLYIHSLQKYSGALVLKEAK